METIRFETGPELKAGELKGMPLNSGLYDGGLFHVPWCSIPGRGELREGQDGVVRMAVNRAHEFFFISHGEQTEVVLNGKSSLFPSFALPTTHLGKPLKAVLLDLDGTCVKSEHFWIMTILETVNTMRDSAGLERIPAFRPEELPYISGRSVPEHLHYCIDHYCPEAPLSRMQSVYTEIAETYMEQLCSGELQLDAFEPTDGLKELLLWFKEKNIKIGIVTSGLYYKAWPELVQAMEKMDLGDPLLFFDAVMTAGTVARRGQSGTMGNSIAKPWPNLYFEALQAMGLSLKERFHVAGVGDSSSDAGSLRTMGVPFIGVGGGNIRQAGSLALCNLFVENLSEVIGLLK